MTDSIQSLVEIPKTEGYRTLHDWGCYFSSFLGNGWEFVGAGPTPIGGICALEFCHPALHHADSLLGRGVQLIATPGRDHNQNPTVRITSILMISPDPLTGKACLRTDDLTLAQSESQLAAMFLDCIKCTMQCIAKCLLEKVKFPNAKEPYVNYLMHGWEIEAYILPDRTDVTELVLRWFEDFGCTQITVEMGELIEGNGMKWSAALEMPKFLNSAAYVDQFCS